jgi:hypothetical protein
MSVFRFYAFAFLAIVCLSQMAYAQVYSRHHAADCTVVSPPNRAYWTVNGVFANISGGNIHLYCPLFDNDAFPKAEMDQINLQIYDHDSGHSSSARVCTTHPFVLGGVCENGPSTGVGFVGNTTLYIYGNWIDVFQVFNRYPFLLVTLYDNHAFKGYTSNY